MEAVEEKHATEHAKAIQNGNSKIEEIETSTEQTQKITESGGGNPTNKKKVRKIKKGSESEKENISVHSSIIMFNNICNASLSNSESRSHSPSPSPTSTPSAHNNRTSAKMNGNTQNNSHQTSPSPPSPPSSINNIPIPSNKFTSNNNNKTTSYYHTFNCSRDMMKKRKSVNNFLNRDMTNNTINELKNNFERLIEETQRQQEKKQQKITSAIINNQHNNTNNYHNNMKNKENCSNGISSINNSRVYSNRQDILMNTDRRNKKLTNCYGDDLSNIDVKSLVSILVFFHLLLIIFVIFCFFCT
uniref:CSON010583 protein n=1 Tax=Culicoides sonorensis TaxID=179676 RepID=A0A336NA21_CULSO